MQENIQMLKKQAINLENTANSAPLISCTYYLQMKSDYTPSRNCIVSN